MDEILKQSAIWAEALSSGDENNVTALYHKDAVLWGTLSPVIRNTPALIREYFVKFATLDRIKVDFSDPVVRQYGNVAINTGYYVFSWYEEGKKVVVPARYTFSYVNEGGWKIIDHHSSVVPEQPFDMSKYIKP
jgi:hypothetical protein